MATETRRRGYFGRIVTAIIGIGWLFLGIAALVGGVVLAAAADIIATGIYLLFVLAVMWFLLAALGVVQPVDVVPFVPFI